MIVFNIECSFIYSIYWKSAMMGDTTNILE